MIDDRQEIATASPGVEVLPPALGRLVALALMTGSVAAAAGGATPDWIGSGTLVLAAVAGVFVAVAAAAVEVHAARGGLARFRQGLLELGVLILLARLIVLATDGGAVLGRIREWPSGFFDGPMMVTLAVILAVWVASGLTIGDLGRLGRPLAGDRYEVAPLTALSVRFVGGATVILVLGSLSLVPWSELIRLGRAPISGVIWPLLVYLPVGVLSLGICRIRDAELRWHRLRAVVHVGVRDRWMARVAIVAGLVLVLLAVLPTGDTSPIVRLAGGGITVVSDGFEGLLDWIRSRNPGGDGDNSDDVARTAPDPNIPFQDREVGVPLEPGEPLISPSLRRDIERVVLWALVVVVMGLVGREVWHARHLIHVAYRRGRTRRGQLSGLAAVLGLLPRLIWSMLRAVFRRRQGPQPGHPGDQPLSSAVPTGETPLVRRPPADGVRARITDSYRGFRETSGATVGPPRGGETPDEFGRRVSDAIPPVAASERALTALFEEARFSDHRLEAAAADDAESLLDDIEERLDLFDDGTG